MDNEGNLYASTRQIVGQFHHSSFLAGQPVAAAGELQVKNGILEYITNSSGHYWPTREMTQQAVERLRQAGVQIADHQIYLVPGS